jgi:CheY-like chemotaxis protein/HPt (histidine-containing phosphotransfer) domain-containing protein
VFAPERLAEQVAAMLQSKAIEEGVALNVDVGPEVPGHVRGDAARVSQVLTNLVSNALKFTDEGSVEIRVRRWDRPTADASDFLPSPDGGSAPETAGDGVPAGEGLVWLEMEVEDTGVGIPDDQQQVIFEDFGRADAPDGQIRSGTGLGLPIVCRILEHMGGSIDLESTVGEGTVVTVKAPFGTAAPDAETDDAPAPARYRPEVQGRLPEREGATAHQDGYEGSLTGTRILVAEDNELNQVVVRDLLQGWGAEVEVVETGTAALKRLHAHPDHPDTRPVPVDIVLMDVQMPEMDGLEATRLLRQAGCSIPVVALTASMLRDNRQKAFDAGMDAFVTKPFDPEDLYATVASYLPDAPSGESSARGSIAGRSSSGDGPAVSNEGNAEAEEGDAREKTEAGENPSGGRIGTLDLSFLEENIVDPDVARDIARTFQEQAATFLEELEAARCRGDDERLRELFHWLKSSAHMVGATSLAERLETLHEQGPPYDDEDLIEVAVAVREAARALPAAIDHVFGGGPASSQQAP